MFLSKALHSLAFHSVRNGKGDVGGKNVKSIQFFTNCTDAWGGSEELWAGAARRLASKDYRITANVVRFESTHPKFIELIESGVRVEKHRGLPLVGRYGAIRRRWEPLLTVARLRASKPQLAIVSQGENMDGHREMGYCRDASIPYVIICQKAGDEFCPLDEHRTDLQECFTEAQRVFFVSEHNRVVTEERLGRKLTNAEVVWNPFMVNYNAKLPWPDPEQGRFRLACVARLWMHDKGQDVLLKVLSQEKWKQRELEVHFYGLGPNAVAIEELARMLGVDKVRFCGFSHDVTEIWRQCHALVLPSRQEGLPLALVEAMLCGRTAITTDVGGNAEVLEDEQSGFLARAVTVEAFDEAMERAWKRRLEWQKIGMIASTSIRKMIPEDPVGLFAEKLAAIYRDVERSR
jgi:glycosyltransferase involved in cell wall biosynthesis